MATSTATAQSHVVTISGPPLPIPQPHHRELRDLFLHLLRSIEDIRGPKGPYDDLVNAMLDTRSSFKPYPSQCTVRLTAFLVFMNCNGVGRKNIRPLCDRVEDWGIEFV